MYIKIIDGITFFATQIFNLSSSINDQQRNSLMVYEVRDGNIIVSYSADESAKIKSILDELTVAYTVEDTNFSSGLFTKANGVKYASKSEAIDHLTNNIEPESLKMVNVKNDINLIQQGSNISVDQIDKEQKIKTRIDSGEITAANFSTLSQDEQDTAKIVLFKEYAPVETDIPKALSAAEFMICAIVKLMSKALDRTKLTIEESAFLDSFTNVINLNNMPVNDTTDWRFTYLNNQFTNVQNNRQAYLTKKQNVTGSI